MKHCANSNFIFFHFQVCVRVRTSATNVFHKNAIRRTSIISFEITMRFKLNPETEIVNLKECLKRKTLLSNKNNLAKRFILQV